MVKNNFNGVICYNLASVPKYMSLEELIYIQKKHKYIFYDSYEALRLGTSKAYPYYIKTGRIPKYVVDISTEEGKKIYEELTEKLKNSDTNSGE